MHRAEEDYLKNIYKLTIEKNRDVVKNIELAEVLGFTDQSVNEMVKRLTKKKFLNFKPYIGVSLTEKGIVEAKRLVRNHRVWEVFLVEKLGYAWSDVHEEAEKLEHASSDKLIKSLYQYLDYPIYCVHGNAIPGLDGHSANMFDLSLDKLAIGDVFMVRRVMDQSRLLNYLDEINIELNTRLEVIDKDEFNGFLTVKINEEDRVISMVTAEKIFGLKQKTNQN